MDKINCQIIDEIGIKGTVVRTMSKLNELIEGYNEIMERLTKHFSCIYDEIEKLKRKDTVVWREYKRLKKIVDK